jgi:hypothetical protein
MTSFSIDITNTKQISPDTLPKYKWKEGKLEGLDESSV